MLTDFQRKVLRILYNYIGGRRRFPTIHELTVKTGKHKPEVLTALDALVAAEYIHWEIDQTPEILLFWKAGSCNLKSRGFLRHHRPLSLLTQITGHNIEGKCNTYRSIFPLVLKEAVIRVKCRVQSF